MSLIPSSIPTWLEYRLIQEYYKNITTARSKLPLINHINEGLAILEWIYATEEAKRAYCLHPMLQSDEDLAKNYSISFDTVKPQVLFNAMEYRSVANAYLSTRKIKSITDIRLSPLKDVNDMLIADKIQNRKDFEIYHIHTHPRRQELTTYFKNWLNRLGVKEEQYQEYKLKLIATSI